MLLCCYAAIFSHVIQNWSRFILGYIYFQIRPVSPLALPRDARAREELRREGDRGAADRPHHRGARLEEENPQDQRGQHGGKGKGRTAADRSAGAAARG